MSRSIRRFALSVGLSVLPALSLGFVPALAGRGAACAAAASGAAHAALVVDTGSSVATYCVALGASSISGVQLVQKAGQQFGMAYRLGFGGQAVCMLNGVGGPSGDDCLTGQASYWGYWIGNGSGGWTWSSTGAGSATVQDGDVQGWAWGVGTDGTAHPQPPATTLVEVCKVEPSPSPSPSPGGGHGSEGSGDGGGGGNPSSPGPHPTVSPSVSGGPSVASTSHHRSASPRVHPSGSGAPRPLKNPTQIVAAAPLSSPGSDSGSPVGILLALGFTCLLGVGGWLRVRSGRTQATP